MDSTEGRDPPLRADPPESAHPHWERVKAVFLEALEQEPGARDAFLARACADDPHLRREVESLLERDLAAEDFCEVPAARMIGAAALDGARAPLFAPGALLGPYEILAFVAAGGMGEVYRALHTVLGREVALKVVGGWNASPEARRRLLREARHASVLAHPNICTVFEVGESDGTPFIVMELVRGRPLNEVLRIGALPLEQALTCGALIADALEHAHRAGIVHRDLKSSNIIVRDDGCPVVLDFGLARRLRPPSTEPSPDSSITRADVLAGTVSHMAPEVLLGQSANERSDVWSLGVVLYEMVAGDLPFRGRTTFETSAAILNESPAPIGRRVPASVRLVIERCLAKTPAHRYQHARDVHDALQAIRRRRSWPVVGRIIGAARPRTVYASAAGLLVAILLGLHGPDWIARVPFLRRPLSTVAVLPLEGADGERSDFYASGFGEGLTAQLGAATGLRVLSPTSAARVKRSGGSHVEMGRRLGADGLVEGTVRREPGRVILDLRLIRVSDGRVVWLQRFQRPNRDILVLEADAVRALAVATRRALSPQGRERLASIRAVDPDVYEEYLKGRYEWNARTAGSIQRAVAHFTAATRLDPTYAPAHAALADCYNQLGTMMLGGGSPRAWRPRAEAAAIKALQIDPNSAEAHATLGYTWHYEWRWPDAERELLRALELNPSYSLARIWYGNLMSSLGRHEEALRQVHLARDLDPFSLVVNTNVAWSLQLAGRNAESVAQLRHTLTLDSTYVQAHWRLAISLSKLGQFVEARQHAGHAVTMTRRSASALALASVVDAQAGRMDDARALAQEVLARAKEEYVSPAAVGQMLGRLGRMDEARTWMARAVEERSNFLTYPDSTDPVHADPRIRAMVARARGR